VTAPDPTIDELYTAWRAAFRDRSVIDVLALCTPDYVLWRPESAPLGIDAIRDQLMVAFERYEIESAFERIECFVSGNLAIDCGWDVQRVRPRDGGPERTARQRVWVILRRGNDARWRFARGMAQPGPAA
jgi:ketosteroid isomerase-like protein